ADNTYASDLWEMYSRVATDRVGVLLDGHEGDVTISYNFRYLSELARQLRWANMLHEVRGLSRHYFGGRVSSWWLLKNYCVPPLLPSWEWLSRVRWQVRAKAPERGPRSLISECFAARSGLADRLEIHEREMATLRTHRAVHADMLTHPMVSHSLE